MVLKLFFHTVVFLLFYEGSLFKGKKSIYFVFTSLCPHLLVPGNPHGLNKKEFSASSSVLVGIGTASSVQITNVNIGSDSVPDFFSFLLLLSCILFFLDPQVYKYKGIFFFKLFLLAVVFP